MPIRRGAAWTLAASLALAACEPRPAPPVAPTTTITLSGDAATLVTRPSYMYRDVPVCSAPCDKTVSTEGEYRVLTKGGVRSSEIDLGQASGARVNITTKEPLHARAVGIAMIVGGALFIPGGAVVALTGAFDGACFGSCPENHSRGNVPLEITGAAMAVLGLGSIVAGLLLVDASSPELHLTITDPPSSPPAPRESVSDARRAPLSFPAAFGAPVFTRAF